MTKSDESFATEQSSEKTTFHKKFSRILAMFLPGIFLLGFNIGTGSVTSYGQGRSYLWDVSLVDDRCILSDHFHYDKCLWSLYFGIQEKRLCTLSASTSIPLWASSLLSLSLQA